MLDRGWASSELDDYRRQRFRTLIAALTNEGCGVWKLSDGSKVSRCHLKVRESAGSVRTARVSLLRPDTRCDCRTLRMARSVQHDTIGQVSDCRCSTAIVCCSLLVRAASWSFGTWRPIGDAEIRGPYRPGGLLLRYAGWSPCLNRWLGQHRTPVVVRRKVSAPESRSSRKTGYGCIVNATATLACSAPQEEGPSSGTRAPERGAGQSILIREVRACTFAFAGSKVNRASRRSGEKLRVFDPETARLEWETDSGRDLKG